MKRDLEIFNTETNEAIPIEWEGEQEPTDQDIAEIVSQLGGKPEITEPKTAALGTGVQGIDVPEGILPKAAQAIQNIPRSGYEFGKSLYDVVRHPVDTAENLGKMVLGAAELLVPEAQGHEQYAEAVGKHFKDRYGGAENIQKTIINDPVGFAADAATFLSGLGIVAKTGKMASLGQKISRAGSLLEPIGLAGRAGKLAYKGAKSVGTGIAAKTSGMGQAAKAELLRGSPEAIKAMRGATTGGEIVAEAKSGLESVKASRSAAYVKKLEKLKKNQTVLDVTPLRDKLDDLMGGYGIERKQTVVNGQIQKTLEFKKGGVQKSAIEDAREIIDTIDSWGSNVDDLTPAGVDRLKRYLDDFYSPNKNTRAMVSTLRNEARKILTKSVPEYATMTREYASATKLIDEMERALSIGNRKSADTALRKLITGIKEDSGLRRQLMDEIKDYSGKDIQAMISGYVAQPKIPRALTSGVSAGFVATAGILSNPYFFGLLPMASPRLVGEIFVALGKGEKMAGSLSKVLPGTKQRIFTGQVAKTKEKENK